MGSKPFLGNGFVATGAKDLRHVSGKWEMLLGTEREEGGLRGNRKTMPPAFIIKGDIPFPDSIYQHPSFGAYFASHSFSCFFVSVMPRFTRRSKATDAVDNTQGSSFDPLLSLQPSPEICSANDLSGAPDNMLVRQF